LLGTKHVTAVDPSGPFADACRRRLPGVHVDVASAESLPFDDAAFDHALAQLVVNFMTDPPAGVREMHRVTRRGGMVAAAVWDYAGEMTLLRAFWDAAREIDPQGSGADEGTTMRWCSEDELAQLWGDAGLREVRTGQLEARARYASFDDLWSPLPTGVGPAGAYTKALDDDRRSALRKALRRRLGAGDGPFELTARAWAVAGIV
jgi:SAM-dependent methyltransferase